MKCYRRIKQAKQISNYQRRADVKGQMISSSEDLEDPSRRKAEIRWVTLYHHFPADNIFTHYVHLYSLSCLFSLLFNSDNKIILP